MGFLKKHSIKFIIAVLAIISVTSVTVAVWAVFFRGTVVLNPDYAAKAPEKNAEKIEESTSGGSDSSLGGGRVNLIYSPEVKIDLSEKSAELLIGNSAKSKQNIVVEIVIQNRVLVQSGAIFPGYRVLKLDLEAEAETLLLEGRYKGLIRVYLYDAQSNEREMLSSDIEAEITVSQ